MSNIEDRSVTISLRMLWTVVVGMLVGSFSLAGIYFSIKEDIRSGNEKQQSDQTITNLTLQTIQLNVQKNEIQLENFKRQLETKKDK